MPKKFKYFYNQKIPFNNNNNNARKKSTINFKCLGIKLYFEFSHMANDLINSVFIYIKQKIHLDISNKLLMLGALS